MLIEWEQDISMFDWFINRLIDRSSNGLNGVNNMNEVNKSAWRLDAVASLVSVTRSIRSIDVKPIRIRYMIILKLADIEVPNNECCEFIDCIDWRWLMYPAWTKWMHWASAAQRLYQIALLGLSIKAICPQQRSVLSTTVQRQHARCYHIQYLT